eukprot:816223-Lingulodinium_polyedra.AAC.1
MHRRRPMWARDAADEEVSYARPSPGRRSRSPAVQKATCPVTWPRRSCQRGARPCWGTPTAEPGW